MQRFVLLIFLCLVAGDANAGQTQWVEVAPNARLRMIFSDMLSADNKTMIAMELEMPRATKTYWRVPGETGIPFQFDITPSNELSMDKIIWPFPQRDYGYGYVDFVYHQNLILPIQLNVTGQNPFLRGNLILGICSDICVPVSVKIDHELNFKKRDSRATLLIAQSLATTPIQWDQGALPIASAKYDLDAQQIVVQIRNAELDIDSMIATIGDTYMVFGAPQNNAQTSAVTFDKLGGGDILDILDQPLTLTFMSMDGPYEIVTPLEILQ